MRRQKIRMGFVLFGRAKESLHQGYGALPVLRFLHDLLAPRACQFVKFGPAIGIARAPARCNPTALFQSQERRIKRPLIEIERAAGNLLDAFREAEAVLRSHAFERPQYHQIERALKNTRVSCRHPREVWLGSSWMSTGAAESAKKTGEAAL